MRLRIFILLALTLTVQSVNSQERLIRNIPDIPGYETLICDFHLHTVFSDGLVWPTVRVNEAWLEGIDAIAITDHLEYLPYADDIKTDHNRAWKLAKSYAKDKGVIVIAGTEITKNMPPGHLNAIFIKDATPILNDDYKKAIEEAANQGAFIMWNHPGWKAQQPDTMKWWDDHTYLYNQGWLHGIEIVNQQSFYPEAVSWALEKNLTMLGNSDQHAPFRHIEATDNHRASTLVFVTTRTEGGIREALFNQRTAVYFKDSVIGARNILLPLAKNSLNAYPTEHSNHFMVQNKTEFTFTLELYDKIYNDFEKEIELRSGYEAVIALNPETKMHDVNVHVKNFITESDSSLVIPFAEIYRNTE
ncbi:MAG TPA: PHP domain-containing protein [Bacteroidales bacterium]|nr:PHP domain-containing protein [Bacteroidales bacterium]